MKRILLFILALSVLALAVFIFRGAGDNRVRADIVALQSVSRNGFTQAGTPRPFSFPADHGPHPDYQTEWWYYTGNLETADSRHFGYQLTFFRTAISPQAPARASDWATNQIYFAHFAITDVAGNTHTSAERFSRGAAGLAGASASPYHVWLDDWQAIELSPGGHHVRLRATDGGNGIDLTLNADKPVAIHDDGGATNKLAEPANVMYYYSFTHLPSQGQLTVGEKTYSVTGLSWMDHEFGTSSLGLDAAGWDWFSIPLTDHRELMYYQIRPRDASSGVSAGGTLVEADGSVRHLSANEVELTVQGNWTSGRSGADYPAAWRIIVPSAGIDLQVRPYVADQEMNVSIVYWEGAVRIEGQSNGAPVSGSGYVELTGYSK